MVSLNKVMKVAAAVVLGIQIKEPRQSKDSSKKKEKPAKEAAARSGGQAVLPKQSPSQSDVSSNQLAGAKSEAVMPIISKDQEVKSNTDKAISPVDEILKSGLPPVTRPIPIPLEVVKDDPGENAGPLPVIPTETKKPEELSDSAPEPNVKKVEDISEIKPKKMAGTDTAAVQPESKGPVLENQGVPPPDTGEKKAPKIDFSEKPAEAQKQPDGPPTSDKKDSAGAGDKNLFNNLFGKAEEKEETALDRLMKSLPEISIEEVISEAEEVKGLITEWNSSQDQHH